MLTEDIKDILRMWVHLCSAVQMYHPDKVNAWRGMDQCEIHAVRHFRNVLERREKHPLCDSQITTSAEKRLKKDTEKGRKGVSQ